MWQLRCLKGVALAFTTGETVALREIWDGRVFAARPAIVVEDSPSAPSSTFPR